MSIFTELIAHRKEASNITAWCWNPTTNLSGTKQLSYATANRQLVTIDLNLNSYQFTVVEMTLPFTVAAMDFVGSEKIVATSFTNNTPLVINLATNTITTLAATQFNSFVSKNQQGAGDVSSHLYFSNSFLAGHIIIVDTSGSPVAVLQDITSVAPGMIITCVLSSSGGNIWTFGTDSGRIIQFNTVSSIYSVLIDLPQTPNSGTAVVPYITSLVQTGIALFAGTSDGSVYVITGGPTIKEIHCIGRPQTAPQGVNLSNTINGLVLAWLDESITQTFTCFDIGKFPITQMDHLLWTSGLGTPLGMILDDTAISGGSSLIGGNFDGKAWIFSESHIHTYGMNGLIRSTISTRGQDPQGTDVAHRLIRMQKIGPCGYKVESDTNESSSEDPTLVARLHGQDYADVSLIGTPFSSEKLDYRRAES